MNNYNQYEITYKINGTTKRYTAICLTIGDVIKGLKIAGATNITTMQTGKTFKVDD